MINIFTPTSLFLPHIFLFDHYRASAKQINQFRLEQEKEEEVINLTKSYW